MFGNHIQTEIGIAEVFNDIAEDLLMSFLGRNIFRGIPFFRFLGLSMPETTDDLYNIFKAFKEQDANGNGSPDDEIPFSDYKTYPSDLAQTFYGAWGFGALCPDQPLL